MVSHTESNARARRLTSRSFSVPFAHPTATDSTPNSLPREGYNEEEPLQPDQINHRRQTSGASPPHFSDDIWLGPTDDVEADVLFPQYTPNKDNKLDMAAFDEMVERKLSLDTGTLKLSKTTSRHSRKTHPENEIKVGDDVYRYFFYMPDNKSDRHTHKVQHLLCEEGRRALEETLKLSGWWIDVLCPTDEEMKTLSKTFHIHPLTSEDVLAQEPREKLELYPNYTFICFRSFEIEIHSGNLRPFNFYIFIFKNGLLTFHFRESELPAKVRNRTNQIKDVMMITPDWLNYALMDAITDEFANPILQVEMEAVSIDELSMVLKRWEQADMVRRISRCRRRSTQLSRLLTSKMDVLKSLMKRYEDWASEEGFLEGEEQLTEDEKKAFNDVYLYLGDIQDHVVTMVQNINHYNRLLGRAHTNYLAQVNVELSQTYRMSNKVMNRLTFLATVFLPLTIVCGLFGMNVKVPGRDFTDLSYWFWILMIMMLYVVVSVFFGRHVGLL